MIYLMSDLHGQYEKYIKMLELIHFNGSDTLYILGDFVDRGEGGIAILLDAMKRNNVVPLMGNHDWNMLTLFKDEKRLIRKLGIDKAKALYALWFSDGGRPTYNAFYHSISKEERAGVLEYVEYFDYIKCVTVNEQKYYLSHTLPSYKPDIVLEDQFAEDFMQGETNYDVAYFKDAITVTGHVVTERIDEIYRGRIWKGNNHIALDCGAGHGYNLGCLWIRYNIFRKF